MRWMILVASALLLAAPAQALYHDEGADDGGDAGDTDTGTDSPPDEGQQTGEDTIGAGRDDGGGAAWSPWALVLVLGALVVVGVVAALVIGARRRR